MEAPKPTPQENLISIEKEIKSEQGNNFILKIYYSDCYFWIRVEKKEKFLMIFLLLNYQSLKFKKINILNCLLLQKKF